MTAMVSTAFWSGKAVFVTGGSSGIGRELAIAAARAGGRVGIIARGADRLDGVAAVIRAAGGTVEAVACDAADATAVARSVAALEARLGACDVAIACAGIHRTSWPLEATTAREVFDVNVGSTVAFLSAVLPGMLARRRGHLCGVASVAAAVGLPGNAAYCGSKAAIVAFLESLRIDCRPHGVRVTTACPGFVDTPLVTDEERAHGGLMPADEAAARILAAIERGRAEAWFPWHTALAARAARLLPPWLRDRALAAQPPMRDASRR